RGHSMRPVTRAGTDRSMRRAGDYQQTTQIVAALWAHCGHTRSRLARKAMQRDEAPKRPQSSLIQKVTTLDGIASDCIEKQLDLTGGQGVVGSNPAIRTNNWAVFCPTTGRGDSSIGT